MRRIKSAPANIAEMVNRLQEPAIPCSILLAKKDSKKVNKRPKSAIIIPPNSIINHNHLYNQKDRQDKPNRQDKVIIEYNKVKTLNTNTERATSLINDLLNDLLSPSFEETAFLGIVLNLLNNTFRRDKLRDLSGILAQQIIRYSIMFYIHHYILNDYIERHANIEIIHQLMH